MSNNVNSSGSTDLNWLPSDAEEQLSLGFRIISNAYKTRVQSLEAESRGLKHQLDEKTSALTALQKKHSSLEVEMIEVHQRAAQLSEENKSLISTVKKLHVNIQRLESLKQAVLNSIQSEERDDESRLYLTGDYLQTAAPLTMQDITGEAPPTDPYTRFARNQGLGVPSTPDVSNTLGLSTSSAGGGREASEFVMRDGKVFFRAARARLNADDFHRFLNIVKELNTQTDKEASLAEVEDIFGEKNADLFEDFKRVLANMNPTKHFMHEGTPR